MLLGIAIKSWMLLAGGATMLSLLVFQVLVGKRVITFKGPLHMKVHRIGAYVLLTVAAFHAVAALAFLGYL